MWSVPRNEVSTVATAPALVHPWALGYSGWLGVAISGAQVGSARVTGLPSVSPAGMAVTGRQKLYAYLAAKHVIMASVPAMALMASSSAVSCWSRPRSAARSRNAACCWGIGAADQKRAASVWAAVRAV